MRHKRLTPLTILGVLLIVAGCTTTISGRSAFQATPEKKPTVDHVDPLAPVPDPPHPEIAWHDCTSVIKPQLAGQPGAERDLNFSCGQLQVPVDYANPTKAQMPLLLVKVSLGSQKDRVGSLLVNPGGPGGSGANLAIGLGLTLPLDLMERFDLVGFDPRGVGESNPLECLSTEEKDAQAATGPLPSTPDEIAQFATSAQHFATSCQQKYPNLEHLNTVETARDMDLIREALGDDKLSYLGYSYGTELGAVYATLFPAKVRALVLDGAVDPKISDLASDKLQAGGFENTINRFAGNCVAKGSGCSLGANPIATIEQFLSQTATTPLTSPYPKEQRKATEGIVFTAITSALYDEGSWPSLESAIESGLQGDPTGVFKLADEYNGRYVDANGNAHFSNLLDANVAINCSDSTETYTLEQAQSYSKMWGQEFPVFGASFAWSLYTCTPWPTRRHPLPPINASEAAPSLVVGTKNDPATPYSGAISLTKALKSAQLLTWDGDGHTAYPKTDCITAAVNDYLIDLTLPADGLVCSAK